MVQKNELKIVDQKERIQNLLKEREEEKNQRGEGNGTIQNAGEAEEVKEISFVDIFKG